MKIDSRPLVDGNVKPPRRLVGIDVELRFDKAQYRQKFKWEYSKRVHLEESSYRPKMPIATSGTQTTKETDDYISIISDSGVKVFSTLWEGLGLFYSFVRCSWSFLLHGLALGPCQASSYKVSSLECREGNCLVKFFTSDREVVFLIFLLSK